MEHTNMNAPKEVETVDVVDSERSGRGPNIHLDGLEQYIDIVSKLKEKVIPLVKEGHMSEAVANRIIDEFSYDAFKQSVKVNYR